MVAGYPLRIPAIPWRIPASASGYPPGDTDWGSDVPFSQKFGRDWISGVCATEACTDESLKEALAELSKGCAAELTNKSPHAGALFSILSHYKDIRSTSCKDTEKLDFCQPDLVGSVEKLEKTGRTFFTVSAQAYCTECDKKSASEKPKSSGKKGGAERPNPPSKRSLTKKNSLHICSGSNLDDKRVEVGLPGPQKKTDAPASHPASPDDSN
ncbi:hypothetical protein PGT21_005914 [Puccinia graminis f. sp. tritici]|uniref:Uncharacterized protein n=1 Tax=Puccinia graminis f. sp. tritici TaxID=56615 RepID=A0A5B0Q5N6_PUCGR|nr:hypothetical protein PGT21_005914 [Puccinia graminis f. sp. tritici]KAA1130104.1 hypothetical protein PGTUg99_011505 [Puccinia graminis f. sp. tritici]